ncbi:hypothetical protein QYF36_015285 [Acer negundo]|nr:hypothetical protein QYF36_015285 [Acer negundo]
MWVVIEINGEINEEILTVLLDNGSSRNLLAKAVVDRLDIQPQPYSGMIQDMNGESTSMDGLLCVQHSHPYTTFGWDADQ